jgi:hypothetical protein
VEESLVAIARFELQQPMRVCSMRGMLYGVDAGGSRQRRWRCAGKQSGCGSVIVL